MALTLVSESPGIEHHILAQMQKLRAAGVEGLRPAEYLKREADYDPVLPGTECDGVTLIEYGLLEPDGRMCEDVRRIVRREWM